MNTSTDLETEAGGSCFVLNFEETSSIEKTINEEIIIITGNVRISP